jgi:MoaA/NifB/PqqE/SkfB family radical SAM enzyme
MRRLELHVTYTSPEACVFCSEEHRMETFHPYEVTLGRVVRVLREHAGRGVDSVHLTGGEPTIHPDFHTILRAAKALGMRTSMGTIGTGLANPSFAARTVPLLDDILFSLHGPDAATHDPLTRRPGSFAKVLRAVANARAFPGFRPSFNSVVNQHNVDRLVETVALTRSLGARLHILSNTTPEGAGEDAYDGLTIPLARWSTLAPAVVEAAGDDVIVRFFGVPACALGAARMFSNDLYWNPRVTVEWAREPGKVVFDGIYSWTPERKRTHTARCEGCGWRALCAGVFARYVERVGDHEIHPLDGAGTGV